MCVNADVLYYQCTPSRDSLRGLLRFDWALCNARANARVLVLVFVLVVRRRGPPSTWQQQAGEDAFLCRGLQLSD